MFAQTTLNFTPTTTLATETGNNTSASPTFTAQTNGNAAGSSNVSKLPVRNLLYSGATTNIYAHLEVWFGGSNHMNVGYSSSDATEVHKQAQDMISRGISGAIVDWYGQNFTNENNATMAVKTEAETHSGQWDFALLYDSSALNDCASTSGCSVTQQLISDLLYANSNYWSSPAYLRSNGQPVVFFFGVDQFTIDWNTVRSTVPGNPLFIFEYTSSAGSGFAHAQANGAFSWLPVSSTPTDIGLASLDTFYSSALSYPQMLPYGSGYKGFNDSLAPWGPNPPRTMNQGCAQTWLSSLAESGKYYSSSDQLPNLQIVTWNDYEEGSEIETGIDNCVGVTASITSGSLTWTISGSESTVNHYTVFISQDGQNLMPLTDVPAGTHSLALSNYNFGSTTYTLFVKAIGQPSLLNQMSNGVTWNQNDKPPVAQLTVSPTSGTAPLTVNVSTSGSSDPDGTIASSSINFGDGTVVSGTSASHVYNTAGSFVVTGTVTDNVGLKSSTSTTVTISAATKSGPQAVLSASPASGVAPLNVSASLASSTDSGASITQYTFNWGDGTANTVGTSATATHTYQAAGNYTLTGSVNDNLNQTSSATQSISVGTSGVTITSPANGSTVTSPVHVVASASAPNQPITAMTVYVDNVSTYTAYTNSINTNITMSVGSHHVVINAWDGAGNVYQSGVTITVSSQVADTPPVAKLSVTPTTGQAPLVVSASTSGSYDPDGTVTNTTINWGDGSLVTGPNVEHTYQTTGTYTVTATAYDNGNMTGTASTVVSVQTQTIARPTVDSVTPNSGSGMSQTFVVKASSTNGYSYLNSVETVVNPNGYSSSSCAVLYVRWSNLIYLLDDSGNTGTGVTPGTGTALSNSQCSLNSANSSVGGSGNTLTLSLPVTFKASYAGTKNIWAIANDQGGNNSGWQDVGSWTLLSAAAPTVDSVTPNSGSGMSQTFVLKASSASGYSYLSSVEMIVNPNGYSKSSCAVFYVRWSNLIYLLDDSGNAGTGVIPGTGTTVSNTQCSLNTANATVTGSGNTLVVSMPITFTSAYTGSKNIWAIANDQGRNNSGWQELGSWSVLTAAAPTVDSVTPSSGSGMSQTFVYKVSSANGYGFIQAAEMIVNLNGYSKSSCGVYYVRSQNLIYLMDDNGNIGAGGTPGVAGTQANTQCSLDVGNATVSGSGNTLTLSLPITFTSVYLGPQNIWGIVTDALGHYPPWAEIGTWTVQ